MSLDTAVYILTRAAVVAVLGIGLTITVSTIADMIERALRSDDREHKS